MKQIPNMAETIERSGDASIIEKAAAASIVKPYALIPSRRFSLLKTPASVGVAILNEL